MPNYVAFRLSSSFAKEPDLGFLVFNGLIVRGGYYLSICMLPCPLVRKKRSPSLFHDISFTSNLYCSSLLDLWLLTSMNVIRSSLFPTAIVLPSGDQHILMFSPEMFQNYFCKF